MVNDVVKTQREQKKCNKAGNSSHRITISSLFANCNNIGCWCRNPVVSAVVDPEVLAKLVVKNEEPATEADE